jgi:Ca2+-binding EF-hand superfamily protein
MEFILQKTEGVPENGVLSIKVGETKRQGAVSKLGQPFRFASSLAEPLPVKVEILSQAAPEQTISLNPTDQTLVVDFGGGMKVHLQQRAAQEMKRPLADVNQVANSPGLPTDKLQKAQSAAAYLDQHDLVRTFQDILHGLLIAKPEDPFAYLEDHVARAKALFNAANNPPSPAAIAPPAGALQQCAPADLPSPPLQPANAPVPPSGSPPKNARPSLTTGENAAAKRGSVGLGACGAARRASGRRGSIQSQNKVEALLDILSRTSVNLPLILPLLPKEFQDCLMSSELMEECQKQFRELDKSGSGTLAPADLIPVIVQLSSANERSVNEDSCKKFVEMFDSNADGMIQVDEFTMLTQFVVIAAFLESPEGTKLLEDAQLEEKRFEDLLNVLASDRDRLTEIIPFLPDWLVQHLSSDAFMDECDARFDALDTQKTGLLGPAELLPVVLRLSRANPLTVDMEKCMRFVEVFDFQGLGVIQREDFIDFAQFMAVMNFLNTTVEGQQITQASVEVADRNQIHDFVVALTNDPSQVDQMMKFLPKSIGDALMDKSFANKCKEIFVILDRNRQGALASSKLVPALVDMCKGHPVEMSAERCAKYIAIFDKDEKGTVSIGQVAALARFVIVLAYLVNCKDWHDESIQKSREKIDDMLEFLKFNKDRIDDILPFLPAELREDLLSSDFAFNCSEEFKSVDTDGSGVLEPKELIPLILHLSQGHRLALTSDQVNQFVHLFDTLKNGVLTVAEYIDFARFMVIVAYLETADGAPLQEAAEISAGKRQVQELLALLKTDRYSLHKVVPLLPREIFEAMTSAEFIANCQDRFRALDTDGNGTLSPDELYPVVVELSEAHPYAVSLEHCVELTQIFDVHGDGVIREDEFIDFARFLCVMTYLQSDDGKQKVNDGLRIMDDSRKIEELLANLKKDKRHIRLVMSYLPEDFQDDLLSKRFANKCLDKFKSIDKDGNGTLDHTEMFPVLLDLSEAHKLSLDLEQCRRFTDIFDEDRTGVITKKEFVNFARYMMVMSFLQTEDGQKTLEIAIAEQKKATKKQAEDTKRRSVVDNSAVVSTKKPKGEIVPAGADLRHLTVDIQFYKARSAKVCNENESLRLRAFELEQEVRRLQSCIEDQDKLLKHAEIDLEPTGRGMVRN